MIVEFRALQSVQLLYNNEPWARLFSWSDVESIVVIPESKVIKYLCLGNITFLPSGTFSEKTAVEQYTRKCECRHFTEQNAMREILKWCHCNRRTGSKRNVESFSQINVAWRPKELSYFYNLQYICTVGSAKYSTLLKAVILLRITSVAKRAFEPSKKYSMTAKLNSLMEH